MNELTDGSINFICRPWSKTSDGKDVYGDLTRQTKENVDAAGVAIPEPRRDLHIKSANAKAQISSLRNDLH